MFWSLPLANEADWLARLASMLLSRYMLTVIGTRLCFECVFIVAEDGLRKCLPAVKEATDFIASRHQDAQPAGS